jgi:hypothetical protein
MRLIRVIVGYRSDQHLPAPRRAAIRAALLTGLVLVVVIARLAFATAPLGGVEVVRSLDDHTRQYAQDADNAIPSFLELPGALGIVATDHQSALGSGPASSSTHVVVTPLNRVELLKGFCTARLADLVRQQYPGSYAEVPDAELEQLVLEKHPHYRDKVCVLPAWIDATPQEIVKYQITSAAATAFDPEAWMRAAIAAAVFSFVTLNVYYRVIVAQIAPAVTDAASTHP